MSKASMHFYVFISITISFQNCEFVNSEFNEVIPEIELSSSQYIRLYKNV